MPKVIDDQQVFRAVVNLFVTHGYEGTTTKDIADAANINEATLFRKYGSKVDLFAEAIQQELLDAPLSHLLYTGDLEIDLIAIVQAYLDTNEMHGAILPMILLEMPRHPELQNLMEMPLAHMQGVTNILHQHQEQGRLKKESLQISIGVLLGPFITAEMFHYANPGFPIPTISTEEYVTAFLNGRKQ